jgi:uncharacterized protein YbcC (UPF0753/DUF2309 family)
LYIKAERVSLETDSWLFVAAQHPSATGQFVHYTSPRLRQEAESDTQQLINQFHVLMNGLIAARRKEALELGKALAQANKSVEAAEADAQAARQALAQQKLEMERKDELIAQYKSRLGLGE